MNFSYLFCYSFTAISYSHSSVNMTSAFVGGYSCDAWKKLSYLFQRKLGGACCHQHKRFSKNISSELTVSIRCPLSCHKQLEACNCWSHICWISLFRTYFEIWCLPLHSSAGSREKQNHVEEHPTISTVTDKKGRCSAVKESLYPQVGKRKTKKNLPKILVSRCLLGDLTAYHGGSCSPLRPGTPSHFLLWLLLVSSSHLNTSELEWRKSTPQYFAEAHRTALGGHVKEASYTATEEVSCEECGPLSSSLLLYEDRKTNKKNFYALDPLFHVASLCPEVDLLKLSVPRPPLYLLREESLSPSFNTLASDQTTVSVPMTSSMDVKALQPSFSEPFQANKRTKVVVKIANGRREGNLKKTSNNVPVSQRSNENTPLLFLSTSSFSSTQRESTSDSTAAIMAWWECRGKPQKGDGVEPFPLDFMGDAVEVPSLNSSSLPPLRHVAAADFTRSCCLRLREEEKHSDRFPFFHGAFLKAKSPSCGVKDARLYFQPPTTRETKNRKKSEKISRSKSHFLFPKADTKKGEINLCEQQDNDVLINQMKVKGKGESDTSLLRFHAYSPFCSVHPHDSSIEEVASSFTSTLSCSHTCKLDPLSHILASSSSSSPSLRSPTSSSPYILTHGFFTTLLLQEEEKLKGYFSCSPFSGMPPLPVLTEKMLKAFVSPEEELEEQEIVLNRENRMHQNERMSFSSSSSSMSLLSFLNQMACRFCWENSSQRS